MKKVYIFVAIASVLLPLSVSAIQQLKGEVFSPEQGIICDKKAGFCADSQGISLGFTREYLGADAEQKFTKIISSVQEFDTTSFVLSNGVECNAKEKVCYTNKYDKIVDKQHTKAMFGGNGSSHNDQGKSMAEKAMEGIDTSGLENLEQKLKKNNTITLLSCEIIQHEKI